MCDVFSGCNRHGSISSKVVSVSIITLITHISFTDMTSSTWRSPQMLDDRHETELAFDYHLLIRRRVACNRRRHINRLHSSWMVNMFFSWWLTSGKLVYPLLWLRCHQTLNIRRWMKEIASSDIVVCHVYTNMVTSIECDTHTNGGVSILSIGALTVFHSWDYATLIKYITSSNTSAVNTTDLAQLAWRRDHICLWGEAKALLVVSISIDANEYE